MLQKEYHDLFPEEGLGRYASCVFEACSFILELLDRGELSLPKTSGRYVYHAPCHLRALGRGKTGLDLLGRIPGLEVVDADAGCCGISGSYGFKKGKYTIGMDVGAPLFSALKESQAPVGLSECGTCRIQMRHGSGLPAAHPLSIVRKALRN